MAVDDRLEEELNHLRNRWPDLTYEADGRWILLPKYETPDTIAQDEVAICFQVRSNHPRRAPYAFYVRKPVELEKEGEFDNVTNANGLPFEGDWLKFSWKPANWQPGSTVGSGSNLTTWAHSFYNRLEEGK